MPRQPKFIPKNADTASILGGIRKVKLTSIETQGDIYLVEGVMPEGSSVGLHVHEREDEIFHVLEGQVELVLGPETYTAQAGDIVYLPRGIKHAIKTLGPQTARVLNYVIPGQNFENFFNEMNELGKGITPEKRAALGEKYGITFL